MTGQTQTDRILRMLRNAGPSGITQLDMMRPLDGGPPILALSQRIGDLRRAGHAIDARRERTGGNANVARYTLAGERSRGTVPGTPLETSWQTTPAQPEEEPLVHSSTSSPETRA
jgi:hypothetical protein